MKGTRLKSSGIPDHLPINQIAFKCRIFACPMASVLYRHAEPLCYPRWSQREGRYVGTFLSWTQMTNQRWFGEGEVKFFIDGDQKFPTICGTGTEDYFLGSYGFPETFSTDFSGTTLQDKASDKLPNFWSLIAGISWIRSVSKKI